MKLDGRTALVTGAGSGLGREIALTLAREGANVAVNDLRREMGEPTAAEVERLGRRALALGADVSDSVDVAAMFEEVEARFGGLDILVNNAGMVLVSDEVQERMDRQVEGLLAGNRPTETVGATRGMTDSQWRRTIAVHLDGTFYCTRQALRIMEEQRRGVIINMASIAGLTGISGSPDYSAAKAGIIGLTKAVAREVAVLGIRVNAIAPGYIDTPLLNAISDTSKMLLAMQTPLGRLGTPPEIAAVALYLASDDSTFTTGQVISPNGGYCI